TRSPGKRRGTSFLILPRRLHCSTPADVCTSHVPPTAWITKPISGSTTSDRVMTSCIVHQLLSVCPPLHLTGFPNVTLRPQLAADVYLIHGVTAPTPDDIRYPGVAPMLLAVNPAGTNIVDDHNFYQAFRSRRYVNRDKGLNPCLAVKDVIVSR